MDAILVVNERCGALVAGGGSITREALRDAFSADGGRVDVRLIAPSQFEASLESAAAERPDAVLVGGGDGTVSTAARLLTGQGIPLGVLPLGTLNHFAKDLGFDSDWRQAAAELAQGRAEPVDVGEVNGRVFVNNCSLGAYPEAVLRRDALRRRGGHKGFAMAVAVVAVFWRLRRIRFELALPDDTTQLRTPFVLISNNRYTGHVLAQRLRPQLDDGKLWIYTTRAKRRFQLLRLVWQTLVDHIDAADALETHAVTSAEISTRLARLPAGVDGEVVALQSPIRLRVRPRDLLVLKPRRADAGSAATPAAPGIAAPGRK